MKHKKIVIFLFSIIAIFIIYTLTAKPNINYLALGDGLAKGTTPFGTYSSSYTDYLYKYLTNHNKTNDYYKAFTKDDYRITDLTNDIINAEALKKNGKSITITQAIKEADIITISIGSEELFYKLKQNNNNLKLGNTEKITNYIDEMFTDYEELLKIIRKLNTSPILLIGYYNPYPHNNINLDEIFTYINSKFNDLTTKDIYYIDIYTGFKEKSYYLPNQDNVFPSLEGYNYITNKIIDTIETKKILK